MAGLPKQNARDKLAPSNILFFVTKVKLILFYLLQDIVTMMRTLVAPLLAFFISSVQGQNFGLTESGHDEDKTNSELSDNPPFTSNQWIHSVIFKPLPKVKLTRLSYQVTTFLDFQPFIEGFEKVNDYIEQFKQDLDNPEYIDKIPKRVENIKIALQNYTEMSRLLDSSGCHARPHQCLASIKIFKF